MGKKNPQTPSWRKFSSHQLWAGAPMAGPAPLCSVILRLPRLFVSHNGEWKPGLFYFNFLLFAFLGWNLKENTSPNQDEDGTMVLGSTGRICHQTSFIMFPADKKEKGVDWASERRQERRDPELGYRACKVRALIWTALWGCQAVSSWTTF